MSYAIVLAPRFNEILKKLRARDPILLVWLEKQVGKIAREPTEVNPLKEKISSDLKEALKSGDILKRSVLAMLKSAIANKEIEKRKKEEGLSETETVEVIRSELKKRLDASAAFRAGGGEDRARGEEDEAAILRIYLPPQASDGDIRSAIEKAFLEAGSRSRRDFGRIMGVVVREMAGRADGHHIRQILEPMLE